MMPRRLLAAALASTSLGLFSAVAHGASPRTDLEKAFGTVVCDQSSTTSMASRTWAAGIYDAQIEGRKLEPMTGQTISVEDAMRKAKTLAKVRGFEGYAGGICSDGTGWAAAFPSSKPLGSADKQGRLILPVAILKDKCASYRVDYAARDGGAPRQLTTGATLATDKLAAGTISVTCQPKTPRWQGPVLWFLAPVGDGPAATPPEADTLALAADPAVALATWINRVRTKEGLAPLELSTTLAHQAGVLAVDGDLSHNRELLRKVSGQLADDKVRLIGEDRVRGVDVTQMAWLLWTSPRHRGLILNKEGTVGGIALRSIGAEQLAVLIVGSKAPLTTAGQPAKKKG